MGSRARWLLQTVTYWRMTSGVTRRTNLSSRGLGVASNSSGAKGIRLEADVSILSSSSDSPRFSTSSIRGYKSNMGAPSSTKVSTSNHDTLRFEYSFHQQNGHILKYSC